MATSFLRIAHGVREMSPGAVVPLQLVMRDTSGLLVASGLLTSQDTASAVTAHVYAPNGVIVGSGIALVDMGENGVHAENWDSPLDALEGWYTVHAFWDEDPTAVALKHQVVTQLFYFQGALT
jgi:hypothetical protein